MNLSIRYINEGKDNTVADTLSRIKLQLKDIKKIAYVRVNDSNSPTVRQDEEHNKTFGLGIVELLKQALDTTELRVKTSKQIIQY